MVCHPALIKEFTSVADQFYVCSPTPMQHAVLGALEALGPDYYSSLQQTYLEKRNRFLSILRQAQLDPLVPQGAYYVLADVRKRFPGRCSEDAVDFLIQHYQIGAIAGSDFLGAESRRNPEKSFFLRFNFSVPETVLDEVEKRLLSG